MRASSSVASFQNRPLPTEADQYGGAHFGLNMKRMMLILGVAGLMEGSWLKTGPVKTAIEGEIVSLSVNHIAIRRQDSQVGEVVVHFPRLSYIVSNA